MGKWTEVNVLPTSAGTAERLLSEVVGPLVEGLRGDWDRWHFFWEPELRLRFRWRDAASGCRDKLAAALDRARAEGEVSLWSEAPYDGEAAEYGRDLWEAVIADWMSGSELALAIIKAGRRKPESRAWYWARRQHLFANELGVPEIWLLLCEAEGRLDLVAPWGGHRAADVREAIKGYIGDDRTAQEASWREALLARRLLSHAAAEDDPVPAPRPLIRKRRRRSPVR